MGVWILKGSTPVTGTRLHFTTRKGHPFHTPSNCFLAKRDFTTIQVRAGSPTSLFIERERDLTDDPFATTAENSLVETRLAPTTFRTGILILPPPPPKKSPHAQHQQQQQQALPFSCIAVSSSDPKRSCVHTLLTHRTGLCTTGHLRHISWVKNRTRRSYQICTVDTLTSGGKQTYSKGSGDRKGGK